MKLLALDIGDVWIGCALSDALGILARPYKTISAQDLVPALRSILEEEHVATIVVGYPKTMRGKESQQTLKVITLKEELEQTFPTYSWVLWDERLSSQRANTIKKAVTKEEKIQSHAIAAACILQSFLEFRACSQTEAEDVS